MRVSYIVIGKLQSNCYLVESDNKYLLIDPGEDYDDIKKFIIGKNVVGIILTHSHYDHTASALKLSQEFNIKIYNYNNLKNGINKIDEFAFEVIYTLGHTMDSICIYFKEDGIMFTGDFLFKGSIGRCDFKESNYGEMIKSLNKIKRMNDNITIYPGHGEFTTLLNEKKYNIYLQ